MKKLLLIFLPALCLLACIEGRSAVVELDLEKLTLRSSHIFCGEVLATESEWGDFLGLGRAMITKVRIKVSEVWKESQEKRPEITRKAEAPGTPGKITEITISYLGGRIGERWQRCAASPTFSRGEKVLVFAGEFNNALWATGWFQGKYRLERKSSEQGRPDADGGGKLLVRGSQQLPVKKPMEVKTLRLMVRKLLLERRSPGHGARANRGADR
ncbi:MAG: hypothetical protein OSB83_10520 [Planctomycetota bacterium]|nr:hypothetical protein [Planctomycetota bacterium]